MRTNAFRGQEEAKASAVPGHSSTHVAGLDVQLYVKKHVLLYLVLFTFFCLQVEKKRFNLSRLLNKPPCASTRCHAYEREVILRGELKPGCYLLIPSTYQPGAEARFLIRVFSSCPTSLG